MGKWRARESGQVIFPDPRAGQVFQPRRKVAATAPGTRTGAIGFETPADDLA